MHEDHLSLDEALLKVLRGRAHGGVALRGYRTRDWLRQSDIARKLKTDQGTISKMELGKRKILKDQAKKLAALFHTDYRLFL